MIAGGKLLTSDKQHQVAVFPSLVINTTQGAGGSYSHSCSYASDNAAPVGKKRIYAPCDMKLVRKVTDFANGNALYYQTVKPVQTALNGITHFTLLCIHDNDVSMFEVGKTYLQGQHIYDEGDYGNVTGVHVHYNVALGHVDFMIQKPCGDWELPNSVYIDNIFFKNMTEVLNESAPTQAAQGWRPYEFWEYEDGYEPPIDPPDPPDPEENKATDILTAMIVKALPHQV